MSIPAIPSQAAEVSIFGSQFVSAVQTTKKHAKSVASAAPKLLQAGKDLLWKPGWTKKSKAAKKAVHYGARIASAFEDTLIDTGVVSASSVTAAKASVAALVPKGLDEDVVSIERTEKVKHKHEKHAAIRKKNDRVSNMTRLLRGISRKKNKKLNARYELHEKTKLRQTAKSILRRMESKKAHKRQAAIESGEQLLEQLHAKIKRDLLIKQIITALKVISFFAAIVLLFIPGCQIITGCILGAGLLIQAIEYYRNRLPKTIPALETTI